jgi:hypothetical protein
LDKDGKNPTPVCGLPFFDKYFDSIRTWETLEERTRAIQSHQCILEMGEM